MDQLAPAPWPPGSDEMARLIRSHDWAATPLGPAEGWPANLRVLVDLILGSGMLMCLMWGRDAVMIYNDAYARSIGQRHSAALGRSAREVWDDVRADWEPLLERAWSGEEAVVHDWRLRFAEPDVPRQEAWFDLTYTPVRNEAGGVEGVLALVREATNRVEAERSRRAAEARLRESEARHRLVQAGWETDANGVVIADSPSWRAYTGQTLDEWLGYGWLDAIHPEDRVRAKRQWREAIAARGLVDAEFRLRAPDGGWRWTNVRAAPVLDAEGKIEKWAGLNIDIDARKRAEAALHESEARQAFLLRLSDVLRVEQDAGAVVNRALRMLSEQMGLDRCYVAAYRLAEDRADITHQVGNERVLMLPDAIRLSDFPAAFQQVFDRTLVIDDVAETEGLSEADRRNINALGLGALVAATLREGENRPHWVLVAVAASPRDWTRGEIALIEDVAERTWAAFERARIETALRESENRFRQFADASPSVLWIRAADSLRMTFASPAFAAIYGRACASPDNNLRCWARMVLPEDRKRVLANFRRIRAGERVEQEFRIRHAATGELRWIQNIDFPLFDIAGRVHSLAGIGTDITEAMKARERQSVLVAELQHLTRNLMIVVRSLAERIGRASKDLTDFRARFRDRLEALARVQGLLSRLEGDGRITFDELIVAEFQAMGAEAGRVALTGPKDVRLRSSTVQTLALALHELATNAVKYGALGQPQARLAVTWSLESGGDGADTPWLHIDWRESGVAMPQEEAAPTGGQGRELIERALPYQLDAKTSYVLGPDGAHCTISIPVSASTPHPDRPL